MVVRRRTDAPSSQLTFDALSIEGGLLSPDWLARVAQLAAGGQGEADYRIRKGLNLRDEIGRFWRIAQAHWNEFAAGHAGKADARLLAERFLEALLRDSFEFASFSTTAHVVVGGRSYPVGFAALNARVPVIIAPAGTGLDTLATAFGDGNRRRSPFGLAQEYLNAADGAMWGLVSDGLTLRIVRDNASLTRPAWIEADLQRVFTEERYADFAALWLLAHESRFGRVDRPVNDCPLEAWRNAGREEGTRARAHLRRGVEDALIALGQGFLNHPANQALRGALQGGTLSTKDYFNQLLRLVYRLIFLLTIEERGVLHPDGASDQAKALYGVGYSLRRLRERSVRRSAHDRFTDLWESTKVVFIAVQNGEPRLGLPALGGIFAKSQCPALEVARLENSVLLLAVFKLAWLREQSGLSRVNWRDMGPEELGSVYESLLELVPQITSDGRQFTFATGDEAKGSARKLTGSYYTPDSLVQLLLESALDPVIKDTIAKHPEDPVEALLSLSIVDPACGSGHFLLAAARRLAANVARVSANGTPSAADYRHALRQVVGRCIYGVDLNPMAVELCKVSLWMEAVEPGLPLSFLNSHIQHGNALLGTTSDLMSAGIPDTAWGAIEGDDKKAASALRKRNNAEAGGQRTLDFGSPRQSDHEAQLIALAVSKLDAASDASAEALAKKEAQWVGILGSAEYCHLKFIADAWCAAFVWPKLSGDLAAAAPTNELWRQLRDGLGQTLKLTTKTVGDLAEQYRFFHWQLQFPQVFARGGFDVVLGNPPWERVKLQEQEFFASRSDEIAKAANANARKKLIAKLPEENPALWTEWSVASRKAEGESQTIRQSGRYPLCGVGDVNTYAIFAEHNRSIFNGRAGFIVPSGIATDDTTKDFFRSLVEGQLLRSLLDFQSGPGLFGEIGHARFKFCLLTLGKDETPAEFLFFARGVDELADPERRFSLSSEDFELLNPNTRTCPTFRSNRDAQINRNIYRRIGVVWRESHEKDNNPWGLRFLRMLDMANDSGLFRTRSELETASARLDGSRYISKSEVYLPLLEAKMVHQFDHRYGDYADRPAGSQDTQLPDVPEVRLNDPGYEPLARYWVNEREVEARIGGIWKRRWLIGWRDICRSTDERTVIASLMPCVAVGHTMPLMMPSADAPLIASLYASLCSFAFDYAARQKIGGTHLTYGYLKQLPVLAPSTYEAEARWSQNAKLRDWLLPRILELTYTAWDLQPFAQDVGYDGSPFRWDAKRRAILRSELDAAFFHLYSLSREELLHVMDTFPIVRRSDEEAHGSYRTKNLIAETYDAMAEAGRSGRVYQTLLNPPPADPGVAHEPRAPEIPPIPSVTPVLPHDQEAAILIWALVHAHGGTIPRVDLARAFVLRSRPDLMAQFAPVAMAEIVRSWASKVGQKQLMPGLLARTLAELSGRSGVELTTDASARSVVKPGPGTPSDDRIDPWFRFEARLALHVLRSQPGRARGTIDAAVGGDDRALLEQAS